MNPTETPKTDGLVKQTVWLTAAKMIGIAMSLIVPLVLVRRLSQRDFGLYKQAFQVLTTMLTLLGLSFVASIYYFMPREPHRKPQVAMNVLLFYALVGSIVALFFVCWPRWITIIFSSDDLVPNIPLLGVAIALWLFSSGFEGFMLVNAETRLASAFLVIIQITKSALLILAAVVFGSIRAIVLAAVIQGALQCAILLTYLYLRLGPYWRSFDWPLLKAQLANSLPYGIGGLVGIAQNDLHNYFVSHYFDPATFAIYSVGCFQLPLLAALFDSVEMLLWRESARLQKEGSYKQLIHVWMSAVRGLAFCFVPTCVLLFVLRHELIVALFTRNYLGAVPIFSINLINLLLWMPNGGLVRAFAELRYFRLKLYLVLFPLSWAVLYVGIHTAGLVGAITSTVVLRILDVAATSTTVAQRLGVQRVDLQPLLQILRIGTAAVVAGSITFIVKLALASLPGIVMMGICSLAFGFAYLIAAVVAGAVTPEEKSKVRALLSGLYRTGMTEMRLSRQV